MSSLIIQLARNLRTVLDQRFAALGLTSQQAGLLIHVYTGADSPTRLAALLGTDTAGITRLVDRLADKGLIVRDQSPDDRRAITIQLTESGREAIPRLPTVFETVGAQMMEDCLRVTCWPNLRGHDGGESRSLRQPAQPSKEPPAAGSARTAATPARAPALGHRSGRDRPGFGSCQRT